MKELMLGNAAVARGLYEAGVEVVSSYPGTPSTEITEECAKYDEMYCEWAPNEKVAVEVAFGASLAGKRSFAAMKHVGLNVAADPVFTMSYTGVNGGLVIGVADDPAMHSSQNEQDSRNYAKAAKLPMLEPADSQEALDFVKIAMDLSEEYDTPFLLKMCTRVSHSQSVVKLGERTKRKSKTYIKDFRKNVMLPANAKIRHPFVEERTLKLQKLAETALFNRVEIGDTSLGIITSSTSYQYTKEVFGDKVSILKLGMAYPMPVELIKDFAAKVDRVVVIEELDPFIEEHCRKIGVEVCGKDLFPMLGEFSQNLVAEIMGETVPKAISLDEKLPERPPVMCPGCPHRGVFYALANMKCNVMGDIGCYTLGAVAPLHAMDACLCMGGSVSSVHGFNKALGAEAEKKSVAVIGDSTFMHSGMTGLANIAYNQSNSTVIILDNSITGMTGHQQNPTTGYNIKGEPAGKIDLESLCKAMGINRVTVADPYDLKGFRNILKEELDAEEPSVIISRRPCVLLKYVKPQPSLKVNHEKCIGCGACMKIGCPAISFKDEKAIVDDTICVGCEVCSQLCPADSFERKER